MQLRPRCHEQPLPPPPAARALPRVAREARGGRGSLGAVKVGDTPRGPGPTRGAPWGGVLVIIIIIFLITMITRPAIKGIFNIKLGNKVIEDDVVKATVGFYLLYLFLSAL